MLPDWIIMKQAREVDNAGGALNNSTEPPLTELLTIFLQFNKLKSVYQSKKHLLQ